MTKPTPDLLADLRAARDHHAQEAERLTRAIEALEGKPVEAPVIQPIPVTPPVLPPGFSPVWPAPNPIRPWYVRQGHGGACACPECVPSITCATGTGTLRIDGTTLEIKSADLTQGRSVVATIATDATRYTVS